MPVKVRLTNKSQVTKRQSEVISDKSLDKKLLMSRALYQRLGSLVLDKKILADYSSEDLPKEFVEFLKVMDDIQFNESFPDKPHIPVEINWELVDEYLGDLGIKTEYAYSRDFVNIPPWLISEPQTEYRILMDLSDNTYLTDSNGDEILVSYTGVQNAV